LKEKTYPNIEFRQNGTSSSAILNENESDGLQMTSLRSSSFCDGDSRSLILAHHCHSSIESKSDFSGLSDLNKSAMKRLAMACVLVSVFISGEIIGGYMSGSLALMGDAAHMLSDLASFGVSLLAIWIGGRKPKKGFNFGYGRAEVLGALFTVILIW
jgi:hypothetical protein